MIKNSEINEIQEKVFKNVERKVGLTINEIKDISPHNYRKYLESKTGKQTKFISRFPDIGRGNILRDKIITRDGINNDIDDIIESVEVCHSK